MKKLVYSAIIALSAVFAGTSQSAAQNIGPVTSTCNAPYHITLLSVVKGGTATAPTWTWTWSLQNPNPGNGKTTATVQDLSHWDIVLNNCGGNFGVTQADLVSAAYSTNGTSWTYFTPVITVDPSISGFTATPVLKFNLGTNGSSISYYQLTVSKNLAVNPNGTSIYKSGVNTGIGYECFPGIGCEDGEIKGE